MTAEVRRGTAADATRLAAFLDQEFVFKKGRAISLAQRFPGVFAPDNAQNLFFIEIEGAIVSALVARPFDWHAHGRTWRGAMIGAVHTDDAFKGQGFATRVLVHAQDALREAGIDFTVLWTIQHDFYRKLGWRDADHGVLGEAEGAANADVPSAAFSAAEIAEVEIIRTRWVKDGLRRRDGDYRKLPLPSESVQALIRGDADKRAYALVGRVGTTGVVYEMIGDPAAFEQVWRDVRTRFAKVLINDCADSESHRWHRAHSAATWQSKPLALWHPSSPRLDFATMLDWYVPYFDRI